MYQRRYPNTDVLPPNYKGNAFDSLRTEEREPSCEKCEKRECCDKKAERETEEKASEAKEEICLPEKERSAFSSIFTRRDGTSFQLDDIILGGLIVLLLNSHADDELLLMLVLLFISGI